MEKRSRHSRNRNKQRDISEINYPNEKRCSTCKLVKPADQFNKSKQENDGLKGQCKACMTKQRIDWYSRNREKNNQATTNWQKANPEKKKAYAKATYFRNHESRRQRGNAAYQANKEIVLAKEKAKYAEDANLREKKKSSARNYYKENSKKKIEYQKQYAKLNPEKAAIQTNNYRTRKQNAEGSITSDEWMERLEEFNFCCAYCLKPETAKSRMTMDHMMPLSQGGTNDIENIVPACRPCNSSKNNKTVLEYLAYKAVNKE